MIRLLPPLTIDEALLEDGLDILDDAIGAAPRSGRVARRLVLASAA